MWDVMCTCFVIFFANICFVIDSMFRRLLVWFGVCFKSFTTYVLCFSSFILVPTCGTYFYLMYFPFAFSKIRNFHFAHLIAQDSKSNCILYPSYFNSCFSVVDIFFLKWLVWLILMVKFVLTSFQIICSFDNFIHIKKCN